MIVWRNLCHTFPVCHRYEQEDDMKPIGRPKKESALKEE
jgi:hypothetical protein